MRGHKGCRPTLAMFLPFTCNSVETAQLGDQTTNPDIMMPERFQLSQRVNLMDKVTPYTPSYSSIQHSGELNSLFLCVFYRSCVGYKPRITY